MLSCISAPANIDLCSVWFLNLNSNNQNKKINDKNKVKDVKQLLLNLIPSYKSNSKIIDHFYEQQLNLKNESNLSKIDNNDQNKVLKITTK